MKKEGRDLDRVKDLTPEAIKLGFDFATAVKKGTVLQHLKSWSKSNNFQQFGAIRKTWNNFV